MRRKTFIDVLCRPVVILKPREVYATCWFLCTQPKVRTSSEESMAGDDDRGKKLNSLLAPTPLIRTSSGTHVRPKLQPRSSRHSGEPPPPPPSYCQELNVDNMAVNLNIIMSFIPPVSSSAIMPQKKKQAPDQEKKAVHICSVNHDSFTDASVCLCDPDPSSLPHHDRMADLIPPQLPPKGIRRRQPPSKVEQRK